MSNLVRSPAMMFYFSDSEGEEREEYFRNLHEMRKDIADPQLNELQILRYDFARLFLKITENDVFEKTEGDFDKLNQHAVKMASIVFFKRSGFHWGARIFDHFFAKNRAWWKLMYRQSENLVDIEFNSNLSATFHLPSSEFLLYGLSPNAHTVYNLP